MKYLVPWGAGILIAQILVAWAILDQWIHAGTFEKVLPAFEKALPAPGTWVAISLLGGALIAAVRARGRTTPSGGGTVIFLLALVPLCLLLGFIREVFGQRSAPEGIGIKTVHIAFHAFFFSAVVFFLERRTAPEKT